MKKIILPVLLIGVVILAWCGWPKQDLTEFAQCLTEQGIKIYGTDTCPVCQKQKRLFGDAWNKIDYVNCIEEALACDIKGIQSVPLWMTTDQTRYEWYQSLEQLSEISGCELPEEN